jgi:hypothetical protein
VVAKHVVTILYITMTTPYKAILTVHMYVCIVVSSRARSELYILKNYRTYIFIGKGPKVCTDGHTFACCKDHGQGNKNERKLGKEDTLTQAKGKGIYKEYH